jgi:hypothetical protein
MQRVKSDDLNADDEECPKDDRKEDKVPSPIGAGLPLLQRLRLLKEKQVRIDAFINVLFNSFILALIISSLSVMILPLFIYLAFSLARSFSHSDTDPYFWPVSSCRLIN